MQTINKACSIFPREICNDLLQNGPNWIKIALYHYCYKYQFESIGKERTYCLMLVTLQQIHHVFYIAIHPNEFIPATLAEHLQKEKLYEYNKILIHLIGKWHVNGARCRTKRM